MVINVYEGRATKPNIIHRAETLAEARDWLNANREVAFYEADKDYPNCADALLTNGEVICIQPHDFKL